MADLCTISGTILKLDGTVDADTDIHFKVRKPPHFAGDTGVVTEDVTILVDPEDGTFSIDLVQGAQVTCEIPRMNLSSNFVVPSEDSINISELI